MTGGTGPRGAGGRRAEKGVSGAEFAGIGFQFAAATFQNTLTWNQASLFDVDNIGTAIHEALIPMAADAVGATLGLEK